VNREQKRKVPPFGRTFLALASFKSELTATLPLLIGFLALTVGILLLLARLLAAALLLTWLLTRILVLLARVLVWVVHSGISVVEHRRPITQAAGIGCGGTAVPR
jgi:hypothetical protein